jgi:hypothetical protein
MTTPQASVTVPLDEYQRISSGLTSGGALMVAGAAFAVGVIVGGFVLPDGDGAGAPPHDRVSVITTVPARSTP